MNNFDFSTLQEKTSRMTEILLELKSVLKNEKVKKTFNHIKYTKLNDFTDQASSEDLEVLIELYFEIIHDIEVDVDINDNTDEYKIEIEAFYTNKDWTKKYYYITWSEDMYNWLWTLVEWIHNTLLLYNNIIWKPVLTTWNTY